MHIDTTPNRQSLPRFFISWSRVATQRAPVKVSWIRCKLQTKKIRSGSICQNILSWNYLLHPKDVRWPWHLRSHWSFVDQFQASFGNIKIVMQMPAIINKNKTCLLSKLYFESDKLWHIRDFVSHNYLVYLKKINILHLKTGCFDCSWNCDSRANTHNRWGYTNSSKSPALGLQVKIVAIVR